MTCPCEICDDYRERAAIREYDGIQTRDRAEVGSVRDVIRTYAADTAAHLHEVGVISAPEQMEIS